jgi:hypothetical protein
VDRIAVVETVPNMRSRPLVAQVKSAYPTPVTENVHVKVVDVMGQMSTVADRIPAGCTLGFGGVPHANTTGAPDGYTETRELAPNAVAPPVFVTDSTTVTTPPGTRGRGDTYTDETSRAR